MLLLFLVGLSSVPVEPSCNMHTGPAGSKVCVKFQGENQPQWAICMSNQYIQLKSSYRHKCKENFRTFCYYQCQLEVYGKETGDIGEKCRCQLDGKVPGETLPSWCYSPSGDSCNWYRDCLHKYQDCSNTNAFYAIEYGEHFCQAYDESRSRLSYRGQQWVDAVRKCLQVALVPMLRWNNKPNCAEIEQEAFDSHTCCYLAGPSCVKAGTPSICDISVSDWGVVFSTINETFNPFSNHGALGEALAGMVTTMAGCTSNYGNDFITWIKLKFTNEDDSFRTSLDSNDYGEKSKAKDLIYQLINELAEEMKWRESGLFWFGGLKESLNVDRKRRSAHQDVAVKISVWSNPGEDRSILLNQTVLNLLDKIEKGEIKIKSKQLKESFEIASASSCLDENCTTVGKNVTAPITTTPTTTTTIPTAKPTSKTQKGNSKGSGMSLSPIATVAYIAILAIAFWVIGLQALSTQ
ncbi:uncharacterized protein [Clytia hemisphaerica]|uniref:Folate receptor-like domain-containing protein n=1 Tax=Clytia hemisphaerica TaxID=252671 RepID=A0A7M5XFI8_9CNID